MSVLLLSRPIVNAGDFLFSEKSLEAFSHIVPQVNVVKGHVSEEYELDWINTFDSIVVAGGPMYDNRFLKTGVFPLLKHIDRIIPPIFFLSAGWYGRDSRDDAVHSFRFDSDVIGVLRTIEERGGGFSCRDNITKTILQENGLHDIKMVGCSAWYDYDTIEHSISLKNTTIKNIMISDQGITKDRSTWKWKYRSLEQLIDSVMEFLPDCKIQFTFNGGIKTKYSTDFNLEVVDLLEKKGIKYFDISGSSSGFNLYRNIDLHVGFRVHSHIYCMSKKIPSILVSEDARGSGCNQAMGLRDILDYSIEDEVYSENSCLKEQVQNYMKDLMATGFIQLEKSYKIISNTYETEFCPFIRRCSKSR